MAVPIRLLTQGMQAKVEKMDRLMQLSVEAGGAQTVRCGDIVTARVQTRISPGARLSQA